MIAAIAIAALAPKPAKPVVVMIHGAGGGGWEYVKWKPVFVKAGYEVVTRDLVPVKDDYAATKLADYVAQVESWCPKDRPVVLIGASMGGMLALKAATRVRPQAVILVNSVTPEGSGGKAHPAVVRWANGPLKDTRDSMPDSDEKTILWAWKRWRDESGAVMTELSKGVPINPPRCPSLVVIGNEDTDIPPARSRALAATLDADILEYNAMSHVGPLLGTRAPEVAHTVLTWIKAARKRR
ncbi:MAG: alpha/beta hydrolase [Fimbriimonas sp.]